MATPGESTEATGRSPVGLAYPGPVSPDMIRLAAALAALLLAAACGVGAQARIPAPPLGAPQPPATEPVAVAADPAPPTENPPSLVPPPAAPETVPSTPPPALIAPAPASAALPPLPAVPAAAVAPARAPTIALQVGLTRRPGVLVFAVTATGLAPGSHATHVHLGCSGSTTTHLLALVPLTPGPAGSASGVSVVGAGGLPPGTTVIVYPGPQPVGDPVACFRVA